MLLNGFMSYSKAAPSMLDSRYSRAAVQQLCLVATLISKQKLCGTATTQGPITCGYAKTGEIMITLEGRGIIDRGKSFVEWAKLLVFQFTTYHKVASFNTSCLDAHASFIRLLMKGDF